MVALDTLDALFKEWSIGGICFRLLMATVAGVIIGMDREYKKMREWLPSFFSLQFRQRMLLINIISETSFCNIY